MMETTTRTLLCGDLFTQGGPGETPLTEADILGPSEAFRAADGLLRALARCATTCSSASRSSRPATLACMHGSAWQRRRRGAAAWAGAAAGRTTSRIRLSADPPVLLAREVSVNPLPFVVSDDRDEPAMEVLCIDVTVLASNDRTRGHEVTLQGIGKEQARRTAGTDESFFMPSGRDRPLRRSRYRLCARRLRSPAGRHDCTAIAWASGASGCSRSADRVAARRLHAATPSLTDGRAGLPRDPGFRGA